MRRDHSAAPIERRGDGVVEGEADGRDHRPPPRATLEPVPLDHAALPVVPHEFAEAVECCGCLIAVERGDKADLVCNECDTVVATLLMGEVEPTLLRWSVAQGVTSHRCPHCGALNVITGFSAVLAFTCRECGEGVRCSSSTAVQ